MAEAIAMIETQRSGIFHGVLHSYKSVCKELELFGSDLHSLVTDENTGERQVWLTKAYDYTYSRGQ